MKTNITSDAYRLAMEKLKSEYDDILSDKNRIISSLENEVSGLRKKNDMYISERRDVLELMRISSEQAEEMKHEAEALLEKARLLSKLESVRKIKRFSNYFE